MARKPNYKFERSERDRAKAAKKAERMKKREERRPEDEPGADGAPPATEGEPGPAQDSAVRPAARGRMP